MDVIVTETGTTRKGRYVVDVYIQDDQRATAAQLIVTTRAEADAWEALEAAQAAARATP